MENTPHMQQQSVLSTEDRILLLERRVIKLQRICLGSMCLIGMLLLAAFKPPIPDVLRVKQLEVVDDNGKTLVRLRKTDGDRVGAGVIESFTDSGKDLFYVGYSKNNLPLLNLSNKDGVAHKLSISEEGYAGHLLQGQKGEANLLLSGSNEGGDITVFNKDKAQITIGGKDGSVSIFDVNSKDSPLVATLGVKRNHGHLTLYTGGDGLRQLITLDKNSNGYGQIVLWNTNLKNESSIMLTTNSAGTGVIGTFKANGDLHKTFD